MLRTMTAITALLVASFALIGTIDKSLHRKRLGLKSSSPVSKCAPHDPEVKGAPHLSTSAAEGDLLATLRGKKPSMEWAVLLAEIERVALQAPEETLRVLSAIAHRNDEKLELRMLAVFLVARVSNQPTELIIDLVTPSEPRMAVAVALALVTDRSPASGEFWLALLAGFDVGEVIAPGLRSEMLGNTAFGGEGSSIPFDCEGTRCPPLLA
jgi:hypothetical protein